MVYFFITVKFNATSRYNSTIVNSTKKSLIDRTLTKHKIPLTLFYGFDLIVDHDMRKYDLRFGLTVYDKLIDKRL